MRFWRGLAGEVTETNQGMTRAAFGHIKLSLRLENRGITMAIQLGLAQQLWHTRQRYSSRKCMMMQARWPARILWGLLRRTPSV
jgi:hypothetical protein